MRPLKQTAAMTLSAVMLVMLAGCSNEASFDEIGANLEQDALDRTAFLFRDARDCIQINVEDAAPVEDTDLFVASLEDCAFSLQILDLTDEEILSEFRPAGDGTWLVSGHTAEQRLTLTAYTTGLARFDSGLVAARRIKSLCWSLSFDIQTGSDVSVTDETCSPAIFLVDSEYILTNIAELEALL
ncbi:MAG: hypothetical protein ACOH14_05920 [Rhodoglobus sp.]